MSIINGRDFGQGMFLLRVKESFPMSPAGSITQIPLGDLPCDAPNGTKYAVLALVVRLRGMSFLRKADSFSDGVTLVQLIQELGLRLAQGAPPSAFDGGDYLIQGVDGYRALQALTYLSGMPPIIVDGDAKNDTPTAPTANKSTTAVVTTVYKQSLRGWLQNAVPYDASFNTPARTWTEDIWFHLWVGVNRSEQWGASAIPADWFNGQKPRCNAQVGVGNLQITLGATVDVATVSYPSPPLCDVYALCTTYSPGKRPFPLVPNIRTYQADSSRFKTFRGIRQYLGFEKALNAGNMQTVDYTRVEVKNMGTDLIESQMNLNLVAQTAISYEDPDALGFTYSQTALTNRSGTRYTRSGMPLLAFHGRNTMQYGNPLVQTDVNVITSGETRHDVLDVILVPRTPDVDSLAREWVDDPQATVGSQTDNGNSQASFQATGKQLVVPGTVDSSLASVPVLTHAVVQK